MPGCRRANEQNRQLASTDVGRLEAQVVVEVGARAVALLALAIGQPADREQIRRLEQADALVERQPLAALQLLVDVGQSGRVQS